MATNEDYLVLIEICIDISIVVIDQANAVDFYTSSSGTFCFGMFRTAFYILPSG